MDLRSTSLLLCLCLLIISSVQSIDRLDIKKAWSEKKPARILGIYEKYPSLFLSGETRYFLAQSFLSFSKPREAVSACAKAAMENQFRPCYKLLKELRKKFPLDYRFGLGRVHYELGDMQKSFRAYYGLLSEVPTDSESRIYLIRIFQYLQQHDYGWEQLQYLDNLPEDLRRYSRQIEKQIQQLKHRFGKGKREYKEDWEAGLYLYVIAAEGPSPSLIEFLSDLYKKREGQEPTSYKYAVRQANLLFAAKKTGETLQTLAMLETQPLPPAQVLSLESLKSRMEKQGLIKLERPPQKTAAHHKSPTQERKPEQFKRPLETPGAPAQYSAVKSMNLKPLDISELPLATADDLSPIHRVEEKVKKRISQAGSDYEMRHIVRELDRAENELLKSESSSQALEAYLKSQRGQEIQELVQEQETKFEKVDQKNAAQFNGEYNKFQEAMDSAGTQKEKKKKFQQFLDRWWRLSQGDDVNLLTQGAIKAYSKTDEGNKLAREVYQLGIELKLKPPHLEMDESFFQDRGF
jgi:hypothetical protein